MKKNELVRTIANSLRITQMDVRVILDEYYKAAVADLKTNGETNLHGLATITAITHPTVKEHTVTLGNRTIIIPESPPKPRLKAKISPSLRILFKKNPPKISHNPPKKQTFSPNTVTKTKN